MIRRILRKEAFIRWIKVKIWNGIGIKEKGNAEKSRKTEEYLYLKVEKGSVCPFIIIHEQIEIEANWKRVQF